MFKTSSLLKHTENYLIVLLWVLLASIPMFFISSKNELTWVELKEPLGTLGMLFVVFLINRLFLVPRVLLKKKNLTYFLLVVLLIGAFSLVMFLFHDKPEETLTRKRDNSIALQRRLLPPGTPPINNMPPPFPRDEGRPIGLPPFANFAILGFLLVGFDTGLNAFFKLSKAEKERTRLEKENVINQLDMLRHQVSPHFLMNTLNNIHTLIDISSDKAKDAVIKLSKLMRYLLYDTADNSTTLKNEITFLESYVELMKLRVSEKVDIILNIPPEIPNKNIPPLLFTSFVENAFKHGISYKNSSFIIIDIIADNKAMDVTVKNSNHKKKEPDQSSGIGLENSKKRLDLLYGKDYELDIVENDEIFSVHLTIPFKNENS